MKMLWNRRSGGGTNMRVENVKGWLARIESEKEAELNEMEGLEGVSNA